MEKKKKIVNELGDIFIFNVIVAVAVAAAMGQADGQAASNYISQLRTCTKQEKIFRQINLNSSAAAAALNF